MDVQELYSPDVVYTQEEDSIACDTPRSASPEPAHHSSVKIGIAPRLSISTSKVSWYQAVTSSMSYRHSENSKNACGYNNDAKRSTLMEMTVLLGVYTRIDSAAQGADCTLDSSSWPPEFIFYLSSLFCTIPHINDMLGWLRALLAVHDR
jgi:hypothetical protein